MMLELSKLSPDVQPSPQGLRASAAAKRPRRALAAIAGAVFRRASASSLDALSAKGA
jgi:hypothetical protein